MLAVSIFDAELVALDVTPEQMHVLSTLTASSKKSDILLAMAIIAKCLEHQGDD